MATLNSESANGSLPSLYNGKFLPQPRTVSDEFHFHSWRVVGLLPDRGTPNLIDMLKRARLGPWGDINYLPFSTTTGSTTGLRLGSARNGKFRDTTDGLSQTILVGERAGRPDYYTSGRLADAYPYESPNDLTLDSQQAAWGVSTHFVQLLFSSQQTVNASNYGGLFAFHTSGANVALADGSVRRLSISTSTPVLNALVTRANNDLGNIE